jgi:hypothetical protein
MLNEVGALKVHSHLVLGDSRVEFPPNTMAKSHLGLKKPSCHENYM